MATVKAPSIGEMRFVVKLENPNKDPDGAGGRIEDFEQMVTTRGCVRKIKGSVSFEQGYEELVSEWQAFVYWRRAYDSLITKDTRLIYDNRFFKILTKEIVEQTRMIMFFTLLEVE